MSVTSPFVFDKPVPPEDLIGRDALLDAIRDRAAHGRFMRLSAPRRFGKTSVVHRLASDGQRSGDFHVVLVDLLGVTDLAGVTRRIGRAFANLPENGRLRRALTDLFKHVPSLAATAGFGPVSVAVTPKVAADDPASLEALLELPAKAARSLDATVLVVLDEFQQIAEIDGGEETIRSVIQHQGGVPAYLFTGSQPSLMRTMFTDKRRALYAQAERLELWKLPTDELGAFVEAKFAETGRSIAPEALVTYLDFVRGHPQRSMLMAHHLWNRTLDGGTATAGDWFDAVDVAVLEFGEGEGPAELSQLTRPQQQVAQLVAHGEPVTGAAAGRIGLAKSSAVQSLASLQRRTVITEGEPLRVLDPLFAEWIRRRNPLV